MGNRRDETRQPKRPEQDCAVVAQMRRIEARPECHGAAQRGEHRRSHHVRSAEGPAAGKAVVDQGNGGTPHQQQDALEVELHAQKVRLGGVRHERMEASDGQC